MSMEVVTEEVPYTVGDPDGLHLLVVPPMEVYIKARDYDWNKNKGKEGDFNDDAELFHCWTPYLMAFPVWGFNTIDVWVVAGPVTSVEDPLFILPWPHCNQWGHTAGICSGAETVARPTNIFEAFNVFLTTTFRYGIQREGNCPPNFPRTVTDVFRYWESLSREEVLGLPYVPSGYPTVRAAVPWRQDVTVLERHFALLAD